jgi:UDP-N-acetylglucosamine--N-acetylmuramyl-(pentapeptide) pyrophosphoryl-undecaprenol N-acetylglucosamine transferase
MTGGGSGGHITPILAVAHDIKREHEATITYIGQKGDVFGQMVADSDVIDAFYNVSAGKFRRYHGQGIRQFFDIEILYLNVRDALRTLRGLVQAYRLLGRIKPDVVFSKGGFVGVPVGLAAAMRRIPYVTHDSDAIPGLANKIISKWATRHAVAMDVDIYPYPPEKTISVGVPVGHGYEEVGHSTKRAYRRQLGLAQYKHMLLVTGGGLGASSINAAIVACAEELLRTVPDLVIVHTVGKNHEESMSEAYTKELSGSYRKRVIVRDYLQDLYRYSAAADVVLARGGATNFAELALQAKPSIIVPNPLLTGGHQVKNAQYYSKKGAIVLLDEDTVRTDTQKVGAIIRGVLLDEDFQARLSRNIRAMSRPNATRELAEVILNVGSTDATAKI